MTTRSGRRQRVGRMMLIPAAPKNPRGGARIARGALDVFVAAVVLYQAQIRNLAQIGSGCRPRARISPSIIERQPASHLMPERRRYVFDWENATVQFTGRALIEACRRNREAHRLVAEALERALRRARRGRDRQKLKKPPAAVP
jgi:hypothetical protein